VTAAPPLPFAVVAAARWTCHWGGINNPEGGLAGQLTKCRLGGLVFYVRENTARDHFNQSSGERMAMKRGEVRGVQVLELWAPPAMWGRVADLVRAADPLGRPVR
jgi:hypothetical protein